MFVHLPRLPNQLPRHPLLPPLKPVNYTFLLCGEDWLLVHDRWNMHPWYVLMGPRRLLQLVSHHPQPTEPTRSEGGFIPAQTGPKQMELKLGPAG